ncbi:MAG: hypothetical protein OSA98_19350 [Rubripirellula sp.]|nr:hypothetical protein [Rubripirellula sp.]
MKMLVKLTAIAVCFIGLQASKASAEFPVGDRSDVWVVDTGVGNISGGKGNGYTEVEWTCLMLLDLGFTDYEVMVLLGDEAIAIPNLLSSGDQQADAIAIPNLFRHEAIAIPNLLSSGDQQADAIAIPNLFRREAIAIPAF